jgi:hypothetical protein
VNNKGCVSKTVEISIEKYNYFVALEARVEAMKDFTVKSEYRPEKEEIASILGFWLPEKELVHEEIS